MCRSRQFYDCFNRGRSEFAVPYKPVSILFSIQQAKEDAGRARSGIGFMSKEESPRKRRLHFSRRASIYVVDGNSAELTRSTKHIVIEMSARRSFHRTLRQWTAGTVPKRR